MRTTPHSPTPAATVRSCANSPDRELRAVVEWAVAARRRSFTYGWSRVDQQTAMAHVARLEGWLRTHFRFGKEAIAAFDAELGMSLRLVMPGNAAGKAKLQQYQRILFTA